MELRTDFKSWPIRYEDIIDNGVMRYHSAFSLPSLQYISSVHLVASYWSKHLKDFKYQLTWLQVCRLGNKIKSELEDILKPSCLRANIAHLVILLGQEICNWVQFYDYYVFKKQRNKKCVAVNYVDKIVWSPRGSIDHLNTAKAMMNVKKSLMYKSCCILCNTCANSHETLIGFPAFIWEFGMSASEDEHNPMHYFWVNFMHRSEEEFDEIVSSKCLYCFEREASRFLKDTPGSEYDINVITNLHFEFYIDYSCYILSKLSESQQRNLMDFGTLFDDVIPQFLMEPLYLDYFLPTLYHVKDEIPEENVCQLLFDLNNLIGDHYCDATKGYTYLYEKYVFFFKEVWSFLPDIVKDYVLDSEIKAFDWLWRYNSVPMLSTYFANSRPNVKSMLLFTAEALNFCEDLIKYGNWEMFERYICPVFFNARDEETFSLKLDFVNETKNLFWHFIKHKSWEQLNRFFNWAYESENERTESKKMLLRDVFIYEVNDFRFTSKMHYTTRYQSNSNSNGVTDFTRYDELLRWCFRTRKEITKFKQTELCKTSNFTEIIRDMIKRKRLDIIEQFLSWCFSNNKRLIKEYKKNFGNELTSLEERANEGPLPKRRRLR